ncbi:MULTISPECIES: SIR2 family NAD-dependent protein deacylase [Lentzea]|uniref:protein acetyllysine N-acetyltransferase n=1 Tax=Lentzea flaviverrucosa TaxID=200379 RepID=A0A1H9WFK3_9PSEU|nr:MULTISPECIES: Sir2 family NAD-dependent protein deacetylase [Lentzea]MCR3751045.1 NAD-dependent deacetylase [Lentzea californiensis]RDI22140.1 NAD-dependent deacetylase [Lentzea flaviverrucosa]SES32569.1 NAD-dependent deacetylase [Lentzea flaviverrucosa]
MPSQACAEARALVASAHRITVLTGAGVSTDSGIPDFRGPAGLWTRDADAGRGSSLQAYLADAELRRLAWRAKLDSPVWTARPNAAHKALVELERSGRLRTVVTQNIDGLHQKAGSDPHRVLELHGTLHATVCLGCGATGPMRDALKRVAGGEQEPDCPRCRGILKSATISFGQELDGEVLRRARLAALDCDVLLVAGTSLSVQPAAGLVSLAAKAGAQVIICNAEPTPYDAVAAVVLHEPVGDVLPDLSSVPPSGGGRFSSWGDPSTWS